MLKFGKSLFSVDNVAKECKQIAQATQISPSTVTRRRSDSTTPAAQQATFWPHSSNQPHGKIESSIVTSSLIDEGHRMKSVICCHNCECHREQFDSVAVQPVDLRSRWRTGPGSTGRQLHSAAASLIACELVDFAVDEQLLRCWATEQSELSDSSANCSR
jgi:hypothetical protein